MNHLSLWNTNYGTTNWKINIMKLNTVEEKKSLLGGGVEFGDRLYWEGDGTAEEAVPVIIDDFEEGDRLYRKNDETGEIVFGTVTEVCDDFLRVTIDADAWADAGETVEVDMEKFEVGSDGKHLDFEGWSKCLNLSTISPGDMLSYLSEYDEGIQVRNYAKVLTYVPDEYLMVEFMATAEKKSFRYTYWGKPNLGLEKALIKFELEG